MAVGDAPMLVYRQDGQYNVRLPAVPDRQPTICAIVIGVWKGQKTQNCQNPKKQMRLSLIRLNVVPLQVNCENRLHSAIGKQLRLLSLHSLALSLPRKCEIGCTRQQETAFEAGLQILA